MDSNPNKTCISVVLRLCAGRGALIKGIVEPVVGQRDSPCSCAWRITNYRWKSGVWVVLFFLVAFPILPTMKSIFLLFVHLVVTIAKLLGPGGAKSIVADSLLMKQQLLIIKRARLRAPRLTVSDRFSLASGHYFSYHARESEQLSSCALQLC
ncbi:hypothetical protein N9850_12695 [Granulosicoccus sp.]|nr:hypothetical protein [Granulosicoccus sp.]MDB4224623.1 hypothetical protein [Granulosicoccus sp.]